MDTAHFTTQPILSIPAQNTLGFLECVFTCLDEGRLFAITRDPQAVDGLGMVVETATLEPARRLGHFSHRPRASDEPAQIVFSSGTGGRSCLGSGRNCLAA